MLKFTKNEIDSEVNDLSNDKRTISFSSWRVSCKKLFNRSKTYTDSSMLLFQSNLSPNY